MCPHLTVGHHTTQPRPHREQRAKNVTFTMSCNIGPQWPLRGGNMPRQARTTENLKERMADALLELIAEKPYADISVSEITDRADVGRATYYRHFSSKDDVLIHKLETIFTRMPEVARPFHEHSHEEVTAYFEDYFGNLLAGRDVLERMYAAGLDFILFMYMYRFAVAAAESGTLVDRYRVALHSASTFAILDQWITSGFAQSPAELTDMITHQLFRPPPEFEGRGPFNQRCQDSTAG